MQEEVEFRCSDCGEYFEAKADEAGYAECPFCGGEGSQT